MKASKITIEKVVLDLNGKNIELTVDEAKKLQSELDALLGSIARPAQIVIREIVNTPIYVWPVIPSPTHIPNLFPCQGTTGMSKERLDEQLSRYDHSEDLKARYRDGKWVKAVAETNFQTAD